MSTATYWHHPPFNRTTACLFIVAGGHEDFLRLFLIAAEN